MWTNIYVAGLVVAFLINAATFISNTKNNEKDVSEKLSLSDKTIITILSFVTAIFSWLFVIVIILSCKNKFVAKKINSIFELYKLD